MSHITICFIYKLDNDTKTYYGKYIEKYKEDNYTYPIHIGLDNIVKNVLFNILNNFRKENNLFIIKEIKVGIISFSNNYLNYSSKDECQCFDFYYIKNYNHNYKEVFINGRLFVLKNTKINNEKNNNYISSDSDSDYILSDSDEKINSR